MQIKIKVRDVREAAKFFTEAFEVVFNDKIMSLQFGVHRSDRFFLITLEESDRDESAELPTSHFGLLVDDVDAVHQRALDAGAAEVYPPIDCAWKPRSSCLRDPSGNIVELYQG